MKCEPVKMPDGSTILAAVKPGETLTEEDKKAIIEFMEFRRGRRKMEREKPEPKQRP